MSSFFSRHHEDVSHDALKNSTCFFKHPGIQKNGNQIMMPLSEIYSVSLKIDNEIQFFQFDTNEFFLYANGSLLSSVFAADLKFKPLCDPIQSTMRSDSVIDHAVPYFYHHIFIPVIGSSKDMKHYVPEVDEEIFFEPFEKSKHEQENTIEALGLGCFHMDIETIEKGFAVLDEGKIYFATFNFGTTTNNAIFQNIQCVFRFEDGGVRMIKVNDAIQNKHQLFNACIYFDHKSVSTFKEGQNILPVLNLLIGHISPYYCTNPHAFEVYEGEQLISKREKIFLNSLVEQSVNLDADQNKRLLEIFNKFCYRYCPDLIVNWSTMFAIQDGHEDSEHHPDIMLSMMLKYRRKPGFSPKKFAGRSFDRLNVPGKNTMSGRYNVYAFSAETALVKTAQSFFDFGVANSRALLYVQGESSSPISYTRSLDESKNIVFANSKETRVTKQISDVDLLQKIYIDGIFQGEFCLLSKHQRDQESLQILIEHIDDQLPEIVKKHFIKPKEERGKIDLHENKIPLHLHDRFTKVAHLLKSAL